LIKLTAPTPEQLPASRVSRKIAMVAVLERVSKMMQQHDLIKPGETSDRNGNSSPYCKYDDDLNNSIHLTRERFGNKKSALRSVGSWEGQSTAWLYNRHASISLRILDHSSK
jgi:hypothetical protein